MNFVEVARFGSRLAAETVGHALDQYEIPFIVQVDDAGGVAVDLASGASLCVPEDQVEEVRRLLNCLVRPPDTDRPGEA